MHWSVSNYGFVFLFMATPLRLIKETQQHRTRDPNFKYILMAHKAAPLWHAHEGGLVSAVGSDCIAALLPSSIANMQTNCIVRASHRIFFSMFSSTRVSRGSGLTCRLVSWENGPTKMWHAGARGSYRIETLQVSRETFRLLQDFKGHNFHLFFTLYVLMLIPLQF